jgi:hypothetical protein
MHSYGSHVSFMLQTGSVKLHEDVVAGAEPLRTQQGIPRIPGVDVESDVCAQRTLE